MLQQLLERPYTQQPILAMLVIRSQQWLLSPALLLVSGLQHQFAILILVRQSLLPILELHLRPQGPPCRLVLMCATKVIRYQQLLYALALSRVIGLRLQAVMRTLVGQLQLPRSELSQQLQELHCRSYLFRVTKATLYLHQL